MKAPTCYIQSDCEANQLSSSRLLSLSEELLDLKE